MFVLCGSISANAQNFGGFGGFQQATNLETSQQWKDVNYAGDDQAYHTCDIYLPKQEAASYPVVIHIYGSAWFSNSSKGAADLGTIVKALLDNGFAVVCPNHRSSMDAQWPAQIHDIRAVVRFVRDRLLLQVVSHQVVILPLSLPRPVVQRRRKWEQWTSIWKVMWVII